ncbi:MAG: hypothetical protein KF744_08010 [Taibaiella sp.]|nr:hypothetical protein [Taibaiella sp.]
MNENLIAANIHLIYRIWGFESKFPPILVEYYRPLFDSILHISQAMFDINMSIKEYDRMVEQNKAFEANYYARIAAMTCYELMKDNANLCRKVIRGYRSVNGIADLIQDVEAEIKETGKHYHQNAAVLMDIRHNLIAHRLGTGTEQLNKTMQLDMDKIMEISDITVRREGDVVEALMRLLNFLLVKAS